MALTAKVDEFLGEVVEFSPVTCADVNLCRGFDCVLPLETDLFVILTAMGCGGGGGGAFILAPSPTLSSAFVEVSPCFL